MNNSIIKYILGQVLKFEAVLMLLPCIVAIIYTESEGLCYLITALVCGAFGVIMTAKKPKNFVIYLKEGCIATSLSWIFLSFFGCVPSVSYKHLRAQE
ncbi:MAG: TrkH family potassium uptake protein, partial [Lachnospiraceae bacterium]|nr:TrkH family potassium uptake protein [Lachnospiraceae bacterium]